MLVEAHGRFEGGGKKDKKKGLAGMTGLLSRHPEIRGE